MIRHIIFFVLLFCIPFLESTELSPWLGTNYQLELRGIERFQIYRNVETPKRTFRYPSNDHFFTLSGSLTGFDYQGWKESLSAELEATLAYTKKQRAAVDNLRGTLRYRWLNDIIDDCVTVTPGITITKAFKHSVHDISSFHHGEIEAELHVGLGKEFSCEEFWTTRVWSVIGLGMGNHGYPWLRGDISVQKNVWNCQQFGLHLYTLWGLGHRNIKPHKSFHGYGPIAHRSVDVGVRYSYLFDCGAIFSAEYVRRVYARNFPSNANQFLISLMYPMELSRVMGLCK